MIKRIAIIVFVLTLALTNGVFAEVESGGNQTSKAGNAFDDIATKVSQKQLRHIAGRKEYRGGGFMDSVDDAQSVLDAFHSEKTTLLGKTSQGFPVVKYDRVVGTNVNISGGFPNQPTNIFIIKGTKSPSVVPTSPKWKPKR